MGIFNSKQEKNKYTAEGTWPYSADEVVKAIQMGIPGFVITGFNNFTNTFSLNALPDYQAKITIYPLGKSTRVVAEVSMLIGAFKVFGFNVEAMANKEKVQQIMDSIIANIARI